MSKFHNSTGPILAPAPKTYKPRRHTKSITEERAIKIYTERYCTTPPPHHPTIWCGMACQGMIPLRKDDTHKRKAMKRMGAWKRLATMRRMEALGNYDAHGLRTISMRRMVCA